MTAWLLQALFGATLLMLLVLALRRPVAYFFGAEWAYALWSLPALRLVLPPQLLPQSPIAAMPPDADLALASASTLAYDWPGVAIALWLGGVALYLSWQQSSYGAFLLHLGPEGRSGEPPDFGGIKVIESEAVDGPMAVGIWKRRIVVPVDFTSRYTPEEQRLALEHELIHHRRFDIGWNLVALVVLALNWFNPIAHAAFRAFRADQELACDAAVARRLPHSRRDYARALVKSASRSRLLTAAPLNHAAFLKRRLKMMDRHGGGPVRAVGGAAALLLTTTLALAISNPGKAQAAPEPVSPVQLAAVQSAAPQVLKANATAARCHKAAERVAARVAQAVERATADIEVAVPVEEQMRHVEIALADAEAQVAATAQQRAHAVAIAQRVRGEIEAEAPLRAAMIREALERAQARIEPTEVEAVRFAVIDVAALAEARAGTPRVSARERARMRKAIVRVRARLEDSDLEAELEQAQEEMERAFDEELDALERMEQPVR